MPRIALVACLLLLLPVTALAAELGRGPFRIHFEEGGEVLAQQSLAILEEGLDRFDLRLPPGPRPIDLHICQTFPEFERLGRSPGLARIEGFARAGEGLIVIKAPHLLGPQGNYAAILRHELIHVLLARNTDSDHLPRWLNEGIAMVLSGEYRWSSMFRLARMYAGGSIIDYHQLPFAFSSPGNEIVFGDAYAQSLSMTKHLKKRVGEDAFWAIVLELDTEPYPQALRRWTGLTPHALFDDWRDSLWMVALVSYSVSGVAAFQLMAILLVFAYLRKRRKGKRLVAAWEEDEEEDEILLPWQLEDRDPPYPWEEED